MFKFSDIIVGTKDHEHLMRCLGDLTAEGKEVNYQEYVTKKGTRKEGLHMTRLRGEPVDVVHYVGREVKCRGHAIP